MTERLTKDAIELAASACQLTAQVLRGQKADLADTTGVMMFAHALRMLRYAQGAVTLARAGNSEPACALARPLLEMGWVLLAIRADPGQFEHWIKQGHGEQRKALEGLLKLKDAERPASMTAASLKADIAALPEGTPYSAWHWADWSGGPAGYPTPYRQLSDASHAGPWATAAYLRVDRLTRRTACLSASTMRDSRRCLPIA